MAAWKQTSTPKGISMKYQIDLEKLRECIEYIKNVNNQDLDNIEVFENGQFRYINPEAIKEWSYVGLNNVEFFKDYFEIGKERS